MASSFGEDVVTIRFVIPSTKKTEDLCSNDVKQAFQVCLDHNLLPMWLSDEECLDIEPSKTDVFVLEEFKGRAFGFLRTSSCIIVGPRCILDCVATNSLIPKGDHPLFTVAMQNLIITTTGFTEPLKSQIIEKIQWMGGIYCPEYRQSVTHLVACQLGSAKYEKALENNLPVMSECWVQAVWEESCKRNVSATDDEFQRFKCPVFHHMVITCSQLPRKEKEQIKSLINNNGGEFHGELEAGRTKVLIVSRPIGDKYKHAVLWRIPCVIPAWVVQSVSHGHALPTGAFSLDAQGATEHKTSTPERPSLAAQALNFSASIIQPAGTPVNETMDCTVASAASIKPIESPKKDKHLMLIKKINLSEVKKAGQFLDGCNVYISGFNVENTEKLRKIINSGGATRFNEISDSVTHVIVGDFVAADVKIMKKQGGTRLHVVTVEWLMESIRQRSPAPEDPFSCLGDLPSPVDFASPLSKKGLLVLKTPGSVGGAGVKGGRRTHVRNLKMASPRKDVAPPLPQDLLEQYSQQNVTSRTADHNDNISRDGDYTTFENTVQNYADASCSPIINPALGHQSEGWKRNQTQESDITEGPCTQPDFFAGLTFSISGYNVVNTQELKNLITNAGGRVVTKLFKGVPDYSVVPLRGVNPDLHHSAKEVVSHLWLEECADEHCLLPVQYYHRPLDFAEDSEPLADCIITATLYSGVELRFISELLQGMGAVHQAMMARVDRPGDGIRATTHLIAPERAQDLLASRKYKAACKWGVPCVTHQWVLDCARTGCRQPENVYLVASDDVGDSVVEKTPIAPATKRKLGEDTPLSKFELPAATSPSVPGVTPLRASNLPVDKLRSQLVRGISPQNSNSPATGSGTPLSTRASPETPWVTPRGRHDISTPDTPYGQVFVDNPSPKTRKMWKRWIDTWPEEPPGQLPRAPKRRQSTPLAELKRRIWQKFAIEPYEKSFGVKLNGQSSDVGADMPVQTDEEEEAMAETQVEEVDSPPRRSLSPSGPLEIRRRQNRLSQETTIKTADIHASLMDSIHSPASAPPLQVTPQGAGINTQLRELGHIMDSVSRSGGSGEGNANVGGRIMLGAVTPRTMHIPSHADVLIPGSELVEWVDPVVNQKQKQTPVFLLTSIEEREKYETIVRELQGVMSSAMYMEAAVTHLVCESATRNEKILSSIAAGKWVLEKRFLDDSHRAGRFLDEEDYEFGNPRAQYLTASVKPGSISAQLAQAVYRWRRKVQASGRGAFSGMRAIVGAGSDKVDLYKRLIIAGGGQVLNVSPPFSDPGNATVCILELNKVSYPVDLRSLAEKGVSCVLPIYLNNYLINDPPPDVIDCLIPQYKKLLNSE